MQCIRTTLMRSKVKYSCISPLWFDLSEAYLTRGEKTVHTTVFLAQKIDKAMLQSFSWMKATKTL